ncbi:hypothetical protein MOQ_003372 [Trypanosoma cruzi marinkellei]|uniref:PrimPol-like protein 2 n=1 Tax=Trypanosoma cruzi marinkellei TaxID=85056 RepID=K2N4B2_TRYCR|nr:hypothetical protein MOQ_003372 [Trypanosoma cruzi marinkellei]
MEPCTKAPRHETRGTSVNAIFALTGPSAGVLHIRSDSFLSQTKTVDDALVPVLNDCYLQVAVPADQYWRAASQHHTLFQSSGSHEQVTGQQAAPSTSLLLATGMVKRPDPNNIPRSFYCTRLDAISNRHYAVYRGALVIAADNQKGFGGKMFNTLPRQELPSFVGAIPMYQHRNLYVLVDENAAVDPFFDIDCPVPLQWLEKNKRDEMVFAEEEEEAQVTSSPSSASPKVMVASVEHWLGKILHFLRDKVEAATGAQLQECVVLTSSVIVYNDVNVSRTAGNGDKEREEGEKKENNHLLSSRDSKLSFHVHFRLNNNTAFANVRELHRFMCQLRDELDVSLSTQENSDLASLYRMLRQCIDFGVYTRWRAFRLPYNVKAPVSAGFCPSDAAALDLIISVLSQSSLRSFSVPDVDVGAVASSVVHLIDLSFLEHVALPLHRQQQHRMITKIFFLFRFLLPVIPGGTAIGDKDLNDFLSRYVPCTPRNGEVNAKYRQDLARAVFDIGVIQRESNSSGLDQESNGDMLRLIVLDDKVSEQRNQEAFCDPFVVPRPPHCDGVRIHVHDKYVKNLVAEVFRCLCAAYDGCVGGGFMVDADENGNSRCGVTSPVVGDRVVVQYQDGIRAYYAQQKISRYCLNQGREHRGTYPQLYLTYGSIKLRCYSNDCYNRCLAVRWSNDEDEEMMGSKAIVLPVNERGYPKYKRLTEIRHLLFPPLPPEELLRRYGSLAVEGKTVATVVAGANIKGQ